MARIPHFRWAILTLVFLAAVLNYVDRQTLSALAPTIQRDLGMDDRAYANVVNLFLVAYTIAYLISGKIVDALGTRAGMVLFVAWWSVANMLTAAAHGVRSLGVFRFGLGLGEAGVWPAASKVVAEWFPARERALAIGIYTMGATIGATVAPYLVIPLAGFPFAQKLPFVADLFGPGAGWRMAFVVTGLLGLMWLVPWWLFYRQPRESNQITAAELGMLDQATAEEARTSGTVNEAPWTWRQIFTSRVVWLLLLGRLITDPVWYFYQFWFPKYLHTARGVAQDQLTITWIVYAAAGAGSLAGGWLSGVLVKRKIAPAQSRLWVMLGCACLMPVSPFIAHVAGLDGAMTLTVIAVFAALAWLINISSLVVDLVPRACLGTVFSVVATGSTIGGILMNTLVAAMVSGPGKGAGFLDRAVNTLLGPLLGAVQGAGYARWFLIMACLHPVAWLLLWRLRPRPAVPAAPSIR
ncbi:MAG: MFS transporter [Verrucomicrobia bacterium]|nr:MFS transporter [Verrucomicrobiota bacterium]